MATTTTKLGLRKPDTSDLVNVLTDLDANYDILDANPGIFVAANAAALPASGNWQGRVAYQVDTNLYLTWTGTAWAASPGQVLASARIQATGTSAAGQHDAGAAFQVAFTMPTLGTGRKVRIEIAAYHLLYALAAADNTYSYAFININGTVHGSKTIVNGPLTGIDFPGPVVALIDNSHYAAGTAITAKLVIHSTAAPAFAVFADATGPTVITAEVV